MKRKPRAAKEAPADKAMENNQIMLSKPSSPASKNNVRRSGRLQKIASPAGNKRVAKEVDLTDNKTEEEERGVNTELALETDHGDGETEEVQIFEPFDANPTEEQIGMEEKIDYLYQTAKDLKAKAAKRSVPSGTSTTCEDLKYKNLYIDSQKKVEELTQQNFQLAMDLENARGKNEAYETIINASTGKVKEIILTSFERVAETILNLSEDAQKKSFADKSPSSLQPKAAGAQDANKKSGADTDAPNPLPQPKIAHTNAPAAKRNTKRTKTSQ